MTESAAELRERSPRSARLTIAMSVVVAACLAMVIVVATRSGEPSDESQRQKVLTAAKTVAESFTTYDYRDLPKGFDRTASGLTPQFRKSYNETSGQLKTVLIKYKAASSSAIKDIGVTSLKPDSATVIAFVDQTISNSENAKPRTDRLRMRLNLKRTDGNWLVDNVALV